MKIGYIILAGFTVLVLVVFLISVFWPFKNVDENSAYNAYQRQYFPDYRNDDPYEIVPINYNAPTPPAPEYVAFNLNDFIRVKLTDEGRKVWYEYYRELPFVSLSDNEGYNSFQALDFIKVFGPHLSYGNDLFNTNILIRSKDITEVKKSTNQ